MHSTMAMITGFNPCVGRNSSGAIISRPGALTNPGFQSVCWSE